MEENIERLRMINILLGDLMTDEKIGAKYMQGLINAYATMLEIKEELEEEEE